MKKILYTLLFAFASFSFSYADVPDCKITISAIEAGEIEAGKAVPIGDTVVVNIKTPDLASIVPPLDKKVSDLAKKKIVKFDTKWQVSEFVISNGKPKVVVRKFKESSDKASITFGTGSKTAELNVQCIVTFLFVGTDDAGKSMYDATQTEVYSNVVVIGKVPDPTPDPANPNINIDVPDGKFKVGKQIYKLLNEISDVNRKNAVQAFKNGTTSTLNTANAKPMSPTELLKLWTENNVSEGNKLDVNVIDEMDSFSNKLQPIFVQLYKDKKLATIDDYKTFLTDFNTLLDKVK